MVPSINSFFRLTTVTFLGMNLTVAFQVWNQPQDNVRSSYRQLQSTRVALKAKISTYLDDGNYNNIMMGEDKVVLVDACAKWCGPCKLIEPFVVASATKFADQLQVVKFDVEAKNNGNAKVEFLLQGVMPQALPSLILFQNGKHIATHTGALTQDELNEFIEANLPTTTTRREEEERELVGATAGSPKKGFISLFGDSRDDYALP